MEIVFISGWATSSSVWKKMGKMRYPISFLEWKDILSGDYTLPSSCLLVGWSLGGQLALDMLHHPEVKGLLLISSMCCIASSEERPGVDPSKYSEIKSMFSRSRNGYLKSFFRMCGSGREELADLMEQSSLFSDRDLLQGLDKMFNSVVKPVRSLPTSIIHGTSDEIIPFSCSQYLFEELQQQTSLIPVQKGTHLLPLTHPDIILREVNQLAKSIDS